MGASKRSLMRPSVKSVQSAVTYHLSAVRSVIVIVVPMTRGQNLPGHIVTMLPGIEDAPPLPERRRRMRADKFPDGRIAIRDVKAGDLVIAFILETGHAEESGVYCG